MFKDEFYKTQKKQSISLQFSSAKNKQNILKRKYLFHANNIMKMDKLKKND